MALISAITISVMSFTLLFLTSKGTEHQKDDAYNQDYNETIISQSTRIEYQSERNQYHCKNLLDDDLNSIKSNDQSEHCKLYKNEIFYFNEEQRKLMDEEDTDIRLNSGHFLDDWCPKDDEEIPQL